MRSKNIELQTFLSSSRILSNFHLGIRTWGKREEILMIVSCLPCLYLHFLNHNKHLKRYCRENAPAFLGRRTQRSTGNPMSSSKSPKSGADYSTMEDWGEGGSTCVGFSPTAYLTVGGQFKAEMSRVVNWVYARAQWLRNMRFDFKESDFCTKREVVWLSIQLLPRWFISQMLFFCLITFFRVL